MCAHFLLCHTHHLLYCRTLPMTCAEQTNKILIRGSNDYEYFIAYSFVRHQIDRKSVVSGKSVSVRVDLGGRRLIKKKISKIARYNKKRLSIKSERSIISR